MKHPLPSPIDKLTPDLLSMVFAELMRSHDIVWEKLYFYDKGVCRWYKTRTSLLLVSKHWNEFIVNSPLLWVDVVGNVDNSKMVDLCLHRSAQAGVYMEISLFPLCKEWEEDSKRMHALALVLFTTMCDVAPKWRCVRIRYDTNFIAVFPPFLYGRLSQLTKLDVQFIAAIESETHPINGKEFCSSVLASAQHLQSVTISGQPELFRFPPQLKHLFLEDLQTPISLSMCNFACMGSLRTLSLTATGENVFLKLKYSGSKISFPCLTTFTLVLDWCDVATNTHRNVIGDFLALLVTPVLSTLTLDAGWDMQVFQCLDGAGTCVHSFLCRLPVLKELSLFRLDVSSNDLLAWLSAVPSLIILNITLTEDQYVPLASFFERLCSSQLLPLLHTIKMEGLAPEDVTAEILTTLISTRGSNQAPGIAQLGKIALAFNCEKEDIEGLTRNQHIKLAAAVHGCRQRGSNIKILVHEDREDFPEMNTIDFYNDPPMKALV